MRTKSKLQLIFMVRGGFMSDTIDDGDDFTEKGLVSGCERRD